MNKGCGKYLDMEYPEGRVKCGKECFGCGKIHYCIGCQEKKGESKV